MTEAAAFTWPYTDTALYDEGKDDESILVWKKGQELEPAPKEIEEEVKELHVYSEDE